MPTINDLLEKSKKKFVKSDYRPWNYMEEIEKETQKKTEVDMTAAQLEKSSDKILVNSATTEIKKNEQKQKQSSQIYNLKNKNEAKKIQSFENNAMENTTAKNMDTNINNNFNGSLLDKLFRLTGHQKTLFLFIIERCVSRGLLSTGAITGNTLKDIVKTSLKMVKTTIQRLVFKDLITREKGKVGRGGFYCFSVSESIRNAALEYKKLIANDQYMGIMQKSNENHLELNQNEGTFLGSNKDLLASKLPVEWAAIDFEPLESIGFTGGHLIQLYRFAIKENWFDAKMVQDFINYYAYDLEYNKKAAEIRKTTPIGYFMGTLEKKGLYNAPPNYESPRDRKLRLYYEKQKAMEEQTKSIEKGLIDMSFDEWVNQLSEEEKIALLPEHAKNSNFEGAKISALKTHFKNTIWPSKRSQIMGENS